MRFNYRESAFRHWRDAEYLEEDKRVANADQLYGLAAECALKCVMADLGAPTTAVGDLSQRAHRIHIGELWSEYQAFATGRQGTRFLSPLSQFVDNPFEDWAVDQRYAADSETPKGVSQDRHRKASRACLVVLDRAEEVS